MAEKRSQRERDPSGVRRQGLTTTYHEIKYLMEDMIFFLDGLPDLHGFRRIRELLRLWARDMGIPDP
jgi:hypothetical protein